VNDDASAISLLRVNAITRNRKNEGRHFVDKNKALKNAIGTKAFSNPDNMGASQKCRGDAYASMNRAAIQ
jgi:hypothetical protein